MEVSDTHKGNRKRFWAFVKSTGQESVGVAPLKNKDCSFQSGREKKAKVLNEQFKSAFAAEDKSNMPSKLNGSFPAMKHITDNE